MKRDELSTLTDSELLDAIRRGDVQPAAARVWDGADYFTRDDAMRDEARKRGIL